MRKGIYILPNAITVLGMFFGFFAMLLAIKGNYVWSAWAVILAAICDGLDGWVARLTSTNTKFGLELDSLSDVIAFGVAPAILVYSWALNPFGRYGIAAAFAFTACGALRLARFNVQMSTSERKSFMGMPIPAAAAFVSAIVLFYHERGWGGSRSYFVLVMVVLLAAFMVSTLRFHSLKEINMRERKSFWILVVFVVLIGLLIMHPEITLFSFAIIYLSVGILENAWLIFIKKERP